MPKRKAKLPTTVEGVEADLQALGAELAGSALAGSALTMARTMDQAETSPTAVAALGRSLMQTMRELRLHQPAEDESDELDELTARRQARG